jgi:hypothetical protein
MTDRDGWGTARKMIELYGKDAQSEARRRCERALAQDDVAGFKRWADIAALIGGVTSRAVPPPPQQPLH